MEIPAVNADPPAVSVQTRGRGGLDDGVRLDVIPEDSGVADFDLMPSRQVSGSPLMQSRFTLGEDVLPMERAISMDRQSASGSVYNDFERRLTGAESDLYRDRRPRRSMSGSVIVGGSLPLAPVLLTPLAHIPGSEIRQYLGPIQLHFIKEPGTGTGVGAVRGEEHLDSFFYGFFSEVNAIARAHVAALGGNALLCHRVVLQESGGRMYRNQAYNLVSVTGDAVLVDVVDAPAVLAGKFDDDF